MAASRGSLRREGARANSSETLERLAACKHQLEGEFKARVTGVFLTYTRRARDNSTWIKLAGRTRSRPVPERSHRTRA